MVRLGLFFIAVLVVCAPSAHAYVDFNTGSILLQIVLGGIASAGIVFKLFWRRIKGFFSNSAKK